MKPGNPLHGAALVEDPSEDKIKVCFQALEWDMQQRKFNMTASDLVQLQVMIRDLLKMLKMYLPNKSGQTNGSKWNPAELNAILKHNLVTCRHGQGHLRTFKCIPWECELYNGRPKARCYPSISMDIDFKEEIHR